MKKERRKMELKTTKPRFYMMDLDNYHADFLREIILWQDERIKQLEKKVEKFD